MKVVGARMSHQSQAQSTKKCRRNTKPVATDKWNWTPKKRIGGDKYDNGSRIVCKANTETMFSKARSACLYVE